MVSNRDHRSGQKVLPASGTQRHLKRNHRLECSLNNVRNTKYLSRETVFALLQILLVNNPWPTTWNPQPKDTPIPRTLIDRTLEEREQNRTDREWIWNGYRMGTTTRVERQQHACQALPVTFLLVGTVQIIWKNTKKGCIFGCVVNRVRKSWFKAVVRPKIPLSIYPQAFTFFKLQSWKT